MDAVSKGVLDAGHTVPVYWYGKSKVASLFGSGPINGSDAQQTLAWIYRGGGLELVNALGSGVLETRAFLALGPVEGVPRFLGRIDAHALAVERLDARPLGHDPERKVAGPERLVQLRAILDRIHAAGVVHWDLRARRNVLVDRGGRVFVIDFASAVRLRPGTLRHRLLFPWLRLVDESAYLKWKSLLAAGPYTAEEQAFVDRHRFWRSLWFHRREAWRGQWRRRS